MHFQGWQVAVACIVVAACGGGDSAKSSSPDSGRPAGDAATVDGAAAGDDDVIKDGRDGASGSSSGDGDDADVPDGAAMDAAVATDAGGATSNASNQPPDLDAGDSAVPASSTAAQFALQGPFTPVTLPKEGPNCLITYPQALGQDGAKHPVVVWGSGTRRVPTDYISGLEHWASHGFIVVSPNDDMDTVEIDDGPSFFGDGVAMLACLDYVADQNGVAGSPFEGAVDLTKVATSGHSQGAGGAMMAAVDPRVVASVPIMLWSGASDPAKFSMVHGAVLILLGEADPVATVEMAQPLYDAVDTAMMATLVEGRHVEPLAQASFGRTRGPSTAWLLWHLMGDEDARAVFEGPDCELCRSGDWTGILKKGVK